MKKVLAVLLSIVMLCGICIVPVGAENNLFNINYEYDKISNLSCDLDGDGAEDNISIYQEEVGWKHSVLHININDYQYQNDMGPTWVRKMYVTDVDRSDNTTEIVIIYGYHSYSWFGVIRYEDSTITELNIQMLNGNSGKTSEGRDYTTKEEGYSPQVLIEGNGTVCLSGFMESTKQYSTDKYQEIERGTLKEFNGEPIDLISANQTDWETGQYNEIMRVGDYIYYSGLYRNEEGINQRDGLSAICVYNIKTREDKTILPRGGFLQQIGNKMWGTSGVSSGSWSRNLYCFDFDGSNIKYIAGGTDMGIVQGEINPVRNGRVYIGHNTDMEHFEIISCNFDGEDIRTEVSPIETTTMFADYYDTYAVIDGTVYPYTYQENSISVTLNDEEIQFDQPPIIQNDRTLVPMRAIFEAMGCEVYWDGDSQEIDVWRDESNILTLWVNNNEMWTENGYITFDVAPQIINERTLVPVRAISESIGAKVSWRGDEKLVNILYYPPYSGTTPQEYYYRNQSDIINFGYFLNDNPHYADDSGYSYTYDSGYDIDYCVKQYLDSMTEAGFECSFIKDEHGGLYYSIEGENYDITLINDYMLDHIDIYIN